MNDLLREAAEIMDALMRKSDCAQDRNAEFAAVAAWKCKAAGSTPLMQPREALYADAETPNVRVRPDAKADVRRILRTRRLTEELGHGEDTIAALEQMKRMQTALRVITTWCSFPLPDAAQVKRTASAALNPKANNG